MMKWLVRYALSSVGRKQLMALAGLGLVGFLAGHMLGNLQLLNPDAAAAQASYNAYCAFLTGMKPLIWIVEGGLVGIFLFHFLVGAWLRWENGRARGEARYAVAARSGAPTPAAKTMFLTGSVILLFLVQHLVFFKFGHYYLYRNAAGVIVRDMWLTTVETFANPAWTALYTVALLAVAFHLFHALPSILRTLGIVHPKWNGILKMVAYLAAACITGGFLVSALGTCALAQGGATKAQLASARAAQAALQQKGAL